MQLSSLRRKTEATIQANRPQFPARTGWFGRLLDRIWPRKESYKDFRIRVARILKEQIENLSANELSTLMFTLLDSDTEYASDLRFTMDMRTSVGKPASATSLAANLRLAVRDRQTFQHKNCDCANRIGSADGTDGVGAARYKALISTSCWVTMDHTCEPLVTQLATDLLAILLFWHVNPKRFSG